MPYVKQDERGIYVELKKVPETPGQLNYLLTSICLAYLRERGQHEGQTVLTYGGIAEVVGALECCKLEFYRRQAAPYEDKKVIQNGDMAWLQS